MDQRGDLHLALVRPAVDELGVLEREDLVEVLEVDADAGHGRGRTGGGLRRRAPEEEHAGGERDVPSPHHEFLGPGSSNSTRMALTLSALWAPPSEPACT